MKQHGVHAQLLGDGAGVLPARSAEGAQGELGRVLAPLHGYLLDRRGHLVDGDPQEALGGFFDAHPPAAVFEHLAGQFRESLPRRLLVQRLPSILAEHTGKHAWMNAPQHQVCVGYGKRTAVSIAGRSGVGAGGQGTGEEPAGLVAQDGTSPRGHGVDLEHRRSQAHARDLVVRHVLVAAGVERDVGGSSAHVEADQLFMARLPRGAHGAHHAGRRPRQNRVLAPEPPGFDQPAVALHESQVARRDPLAFQPGAQSTDIAPQHRREVRIDKRGVAAADQLDQGRYLMRKRHLLKAGLLRQPARLQLVFRVAPGMHEADRDRQQPSPAGRLEPVKKRAGVERSQFAPVGVDAPFRLEHVRVQGGRAPNFQSEEIGPVLVADQQGVRVAAVHQQQRGLAAPFQKRVGGHRGAHFQVPHGARGAGFGHQRADGVHRGVRVAGGILRQQFVDLQFPFGVARHYVRKRAAAINPEPPIGHAEIVCRMVAPSPL